MRTDALQIFKDAIEKDQLAEIYGGVIDYISTNALSVEFKNKKYSGLVQSGGSIEISRFANSTVNPYGTARAGNKGDKILNSGKVTINIDQDKEIVEELETKDLLLHSVKDLMMNRVSDQGKQVVAHLDNAFFNEATAVATEATLTETNTEGKLEEIIQKLESVQNDWVDGVDREDMVIFLKNDVYGKLRNYIDTIYQADGSVSKKEIGRFHGVRVVSNFRQTPDVIIMRIESIGQPLVLHDYTGDKIQLSEAIGVCLFFYYGTKAVTPDLIFKVTNY